MNPSTPKFRSREFREAAAALKGVFESPALALVLLDGLERRSAEQITARMKPPPGAPRGARVKDLDRRVLVDHIAEQFSSDDDVAFQVMKEMDRTCAKERHLVVALAESEAEARVRGYRAIAFPRERARLVWALARDERPAVRALARGVLEQVVDDASKLAAAQALIEGKGEAADGRELALKLKEQADRLAEAADRVTSLESKVSRFEEERARLLAQIGIKERILRHESEAKENLDQQLGELRGQLGDLESKEALAQQVLEGEARARAAAEEMQQKIRRLEKLASSSQHLSAAQEELERSRRSGEELARRLAAAEAAAARAAEQAEREQAKLRSDLDELREELRAVRRRAAELERRPLDAGDGAAEPGTVALLLDQANLAATASTSWRRKVNFAALIENLSQGRRRRRAVAFVVDNGGAQFGAFCDTLRRAGWDLRIKKPKLFSDGTAKADWDMGIAVEAVELRGQVETVVLGSGDGDFAPLVRLLRRWGMRVEVASFPEGLANDLQVVADSVTMLGPESLE